MKTNIDQMTALNLFLDWTDTQFPGSKSRILKQAGIETDMLGGLGAGHSTYTGPMSPGWTFPTTPAPGVSGNWFNTVLDKVTTVATQIVPTYINYNLQKDAYKIQLERAKQGQAPLDMSRYGAAPIRVAHSADTSAITQGIDEDMLWIAGGIIASLFILPKLT